VKTTKGTPHYEVPWIIRWYSKAIKFRTQGLHWKMLKLPWLLWWWWLGFGLWGME